MEVRRDQENMTTYPIWRIIRVTAYRGFTVFANLGKEKDRTALTHEPSIVLLDEGAAIFEFILRS